MNGQMPGMSPGPDVPVPGVPAGHPMPASAPVGVPPAGAVVPPMTAPPTTPPGVPPAAAYGAPVLPDASAAPAAPAVPAAPAIPMMPVPGPTMGATAPAAPGETQQSKTTVQWSGAGINMDDLAAMADAVTQGVGEFQMKGFESDFLKIVKGDHIIRICPPYNGRDWSKFGATHYNIGGQHKGFSPCYEKTYVDAGFKCPICTVVNWLMNYTTDVKDMQAASHRYVNAIAYEAFDQATASYIPKRIKPFIVRLAIKSAFSQLIQFMMLQRASGVDITDPRTGWFLNLNRPESFQGKSTYTLSPLMQGPAFGNAQAPDEASIQQAMSQLNDIDRIVCAVPTVEKLQKQLELAQSSLKTYMAMMGTPENYAPSLELVVPPIVHQVHGGAGAAVTVPAGVPAAAPVTPPPQANAMAPVTAPPTAAPVATAPVLPPPAPVAPTPPVAPPVAASVAPPAVAAAYPAPVAAPALPAAPAAPTGPATPPVPQAATVALPGADAVAPPPPPPAPGADAVAPPPAAGAPPVASAAATVFPGGASIAPPGAVVPAGSAPGPKAPESSESAPAAPAASAEGRVVCRLCGKDYKNERGLKTHHNKMHEGVAFEGPAAPAAPQAPEVPAVSADPAPAPAPSPMPGGGEQPYPMPAQSVDSLDGMPCRGNYNSASYGCTACSVRAACQQLQRGG